MKSKIALTFLFFGLSGQVQASEVLASKEGNFERYDSCKLSHGYVELKLGGSLSHSLVENSSLYVSLNDLETLNTEAITGIERRFFRWFPTQKDYLIKDENSTLTVFSGEGFSNTVNNSKAAKRLIKVMDDVCEKFATDFLILGRFEIDLKIGSKVFKDFLEVKRSSDLFGTKINGVYEVPGSFESKLEKLTYENGDFEFTIHVEEGDQKYDALFRGNLNRKGELTGEAFVLPDMVPLGKFQGKRI